MWEGSKHRSININPKWENYIIYLKYYGKANFIFIQWNTIEQQKWDELLPTLTTQMNYHK